VAGLGGLAGSWEQAQGSAALAAQVHATLVDPWAAGGPMVMPQRRPAAAAARPAAGLLTRMRQREAGPWLRVAERGAGCFESIAGFFSVAGDINYLAITLPVPSSRRNQDAAQRPKEH